MTIETILNSDMSVAYITDCATSPVAHYATTKFQTKHIPFVCQVPTRLFCLSYIKLRIFCNFYFAWIKSILKKNSPRKIVIMCEKEFFLIGKRLEQTVATFLLKAAETAGLDLPSFFHPSTSSEPVSVNDYGAQESILPTYV
jgi:hypothetical protein